MKTVITIIAAIVLSIAAYAQQSLKDYKPVLKSTLDRSIKIDHSKGYAIIQVKPGIYVITDGIWQSVAIVTDEGVVLIDAPESYGINLQKAVKEVTQTPITTLVYSHNHSDHIGGSQYLKGIENLEIIAMESTARFLKERNDPRRLVPTSTFDGAYVLKKGNKQIYLTNNLNFHSNEGDLFISIPQDKFLMVVDALAPGYVPFKNLDLSNNLGNYIKVFDRILAYDFDVFVGGHLTAIGNRADVELTKAYTMDVYETVKRIHKATNMMAVMSGAAKEAGWDNKFLLFDIFLNKIISEATTELESRWINKLSSVDVFTRSHVSTMLNYVRWDD